MVARNLHDMPSYARLLQGEEDEFFSLDQNQHMHHGNVYYDLQPPAESACSTPMYLGGGQTITSSGVGMEIPQVDSTREHLSKKRKAPSYHEGSEYGDDTGDDSKSLHTGDNKKQNHSEIEKRRRDKMNTYITELSSMVPMCHAMSRKLDKLTVLRMAVQHLKTIRGAVHSYTEGHYKPSFLSDQELKQLILQAAEGFLFVVGCDRGRILYVSESVSQILNYAQGDLLGQSWFDILHPKDVAKVKEQLSSSDLSPRERLIDAKTMLPVKTDIPQGLSRLCPGARRSFFCRMKCKVTSSIKEEADTTTGCHRRKKQQLSDRRYSVIHCTGYLKSWAPAKIGLDDQEGEGEGDACNLSCLVAVGRVLPTQVPVEPPRSHQHRPNVRPIQFISRHALDGKFLFIDQRATLVLGFLPQELLGTSMYEYYHHEDITHLAESHKTALHNQETVRTQIYRFRSKEGSFVRLQSEWKAFRNPWTKDVEYLIAKNKLCLTDVKVESSQSARSEGPTQSQNNFDFFSGTQTNGNGLGSREMSRLISTHVEASKIGRQIAEEVMDLQRKGGDSSSPDSTPSPPHKDALADNEVENEPDEEDTVITSSGYYYHNQSQVVSSVVHDLPSQSLMSCNNSTNSPGSEVNTYSSAVRNNVTLSSIANDTGDPDEVIDMIDQTESPHADVQSLNNHGNDEAAMAVIMSLLEADAGLGGPVDFTGLPWPLP